MSVGKQLLFSVLTAPEDRKTSLLTRLTGAGVTPEMFPNDDEKSAFEFLCSYYTRYGVCPSVSLAEVETDIRFPQYSTQHPFDFWFDEFRKYVKHGIMLELLGMVEDYLADGKVDFAIDCIGNAYAGLTDLMAERRASASLRDLADGILERHNLLQIGMLHEGIFTGFPYVDLQAYYFASKRRTYRLL